MKTKLPNSISNVEEAKQFIKSLFDNGEGFHPEDDAHDIEWGEGVENPTTEECDLLNGLTDQMYSIEGNDIFAHRYGQGFDPCAYYMELIDTRKLFMTMLFKNGKHIVECKNSHEELLLTLDAQVGGHDVKAMSVAGLNPENEADVFTYANHLLGDKFEDYDFDTAVDIQEIKARQN